MAVANHSWYNQSDWTISEYPATPNSIAKAGLYIRMRSNGSKKHECIQRALGVFRQIFIHVQLRYLKIIHFKPPNINVPPQHLPQHMTPENPPPSPNPRLKIHHPNPPNHPLQPLYKSPMRRILLNIKPSILFTRKLNHKPMTEFRLCMSPLSAACSAKSYEIPHYAFCKRLRLLKMTEKMIGEYKYIYTLTSGSILQFLPPLTETIYGSPVPFLTHFVRRSSIRVQRSSISLELRCGRSFFERGGV